MGLPVDLEILAEADLRQAHSNAFQAVPYVHVQQLAVTADEARVKLWLQAPLVGLPVNWEIPAEADLGKAPPALAVENPPATSLVRLRPWH